MQYPLGLTGLGETFAYKTVSCADLEKRIGRLAANKRIKEPAYQKNYGLFTNEFNARCGGSLLTAINKPGKPVATVATPQTPTAPQMPTVAPPPAPTPPAYTPPVTTTAQSPAVNHILETPKQLVVSADGTQHMVSADEESAPKTNYTPWIIGAIGVGALIWMIGRKR